MIGGLHTFTEYSESELHWIRLFEGSEKSNGDMLAIEKEGEEMMKGGSP